MPSLTRRSRSLTRTAPFALPALGLLLACETNEPSPAPPTQRSDAVVAAGPTAAERGGVGTAGAPKPSSTGGGRERRLCSPGALAELPKTRVAGLGSASLPFAGGRVGGRGATWVNIWAAWCEPCKKELPLLRRFATRLAEEGTRVELAFVSLDDDERQLQRFLDQPGSGIEQTYWLREGKERTEWLAEAELAEDPRLPVHLLVGPSGRVLCRIDGSIEESDYAAAKAVFDGRAVP